MPPPRRHSEQPGLDVKLEAGAARMPALELPLACPAVQVLRAGVAAQARSCLATLAEELATRGSDRSQLVFCTVYLPDLSEKSLFNAEYSAWFGDDAVLPARAVVGLAATDMPATARVAISATAATPREAGSTASTDIRRLELVPGLFHLAVEHEGVAYMSGVSAELETGEDNMPSDCGQQVAAVLRNFERRLSSLGISAARADSL